MLAGWSATCLEVIGRYVERLLRGMASSIRVRGLPFRHVVWRPLKQIKTRLPPLQGSVGLIGRVEQASPTESLIPIKPVDSLPIFLV